MDKLNSPHKQPDKLLQRKATQRESTKPIVHAIALASPADELLGQPLADQTLPAELTRGPQGLFGGRSLTQQAQLVTKPGVLTAQRQAAVMEIGQKQGNHHAAQVVAQARAAQIVQRKAIVQRRNEGIADVESLALDAERDSCGADGKTWVATGSSPPSDAQPHGHAQHISDGVSQAKPRRCMCGQPLANGEACAACRAKGEAGLQRLALDLRPSGPQVQRVVDPNYVVDDPQVGRTPPGAPARVFFARDSAVIPASESSKIDAFKSGPDRTVDLTLLGLATEDEIALIRSCRRTGPPG
jgi:hypothetical protein